MPRNPPDGYHTATPQAIVGDPDDMIRFVTDVLGGELKERYEHDGVVMHAEVQIGDSRIMIGGANDEYPPFPIMTHLYVDDVDTVYAKALDHGATSIQEPADQFYGDRSGGVADSQGNRWWLATHIEDVTAEELERRFTAL